MSKLIINEEPRFVLPSLAIEIGLEEAMALQQIHWRQKWLEDEEIESHFIDGHYWVMKTYSEWVEKDFPFWNEAKMGRIIRSLEELPFFMSRQLNKGNWDRSKAYRIDRDEFYQWEHDLLCTDDSNIDTPDSDIDSLDDSDIDTLHSSEEVKEDKSPKNGDSDSSSFDGSGEITYVDIGEEFDEPNQQTRPKWQHSQSDFEREIMSVTPTKKYWNKKDGKSSVTDIRLIEESMKGARKNGLIGQYPEGWVDTILEWYKDKHKKGERIKLSGLVTALKKPDGIADWKSKNLPSENESEMVSKARKELYGE